MSRIMLLTLVFAPDGVSTAVLMTELAMELQSLGHQVTVLTTTPHYNVEPEARARQPLTRKWGGMLYSSELQGIKIYHASMPIKGNRVGARLLDYARFHVISTIAGLFAPGRFDVILTPSPPLTIGLSAWLLGMLRRVPFIYNVQEVYPDVAVRLGVLHSPYAIWWLERLEKFVYSRARAITTISEWFRRRLLDKGVPDQKLTVIPNFVDTEFMQPHERHNEFSSQQQLDDRFVVLYAGNIGLTQGFGTILEAARQLQHFPDICFVIVGDGTRRAWLEAQLKTGDYPNVRLLPYQARSSVPQLYASSDVCLVPLKRGTAQDTFPSKIYTILAAGRPAIVSADHNSELTWLVEQTDCGWTTPPDDATALARAIVCAYGERSTLLHKGLNGRTYVVAHHSRQAVIHKYHELIQQVTYAD